MIELDYKTITQVVNVEKIQLGRLNVF